MFAKIKQILPYFLLIVFFVLGTISLLTCGVSDEDEKPTIIGCNSVKYKGYTFTHLGCEPGIASFKTSGTQGEHEFCFFITCYGGCISSVEVCR